MSARKEILIQCGRALYGERWQTDLARDLGLSDGRRIRQWLSGGHPPLPQPLAAATREGRGFHTSKTATFPVIETSKVAGRFLPGLTKSRRLQARRGAERGFRLCPLVTDPFLRYMG